ncbi:hypothetical protein D7B24_008289 [Verticillium nonalfalfae]|uniref:Myotubularin phosphatase domain-containing protein n=1 Tax=Verticillium nonalfalfae TaxID=1051616 RepID=A0A3M9Y5E3_9PEZI|nr:uncharacterized protein D7B24_008289 [Verticillium nonalfalfae]RNJ55667.1 hypothetical protein D7B24_008289 [Verticillium nonalfalfae]
MEARKVIPEVQCINGGLTTTGTLRLTDFHLVFCAPVPEPKDTPDSSATTGVPKTRESWISFTMISQFTLRPTPPTSGIPSSIRLKGRDFIYVAFNFMDDKIAREVFDFVKVRTCKLGTVQKLYAFSHKPSKHEQSVNGWEIYDAKAEFRRQGISEKSTDKGWRITWINKDYSFCDTYPAMLVVPSSISDNVLKYAKDYRSRCRIPALSYIHPVNNCTITRSSQPLSGITRKNNIQDEKLVAACFSASPPYNEGDLPPPPSQIDAIEAQLTDSERFEDSFLANTPNMYDEKTGQRLIYGAQQSNLIVDARPTVNAMVNQVQGMGSEPMDRYPGSRKVFLSIENIHIMRNSLNKVVEAIKDADISPLPPNRELLASSGWLKHTRAVLQGASLITRQIGIFHSHVLIHCSDGWDRTSQLSALSQLMLDPYYRSIEGFIVLIEKDWLSFGHMFRLRSGHLNHESNFQIQRDAMAGATVQPGENDGRGDAFQSAIASARRFFNQNKDDAAELDTALEGSTGTVANGEATDPKMISPVFHQFLDCVYQLLRQNPDRFEFNERFLRRLLYHLYSCQYGTFLYNSEKQRHDVDLSHKTSSVWGYFLSRKAEFTNKAYNPTVDDHTKGLERIILPVLDNIRWWHQSFNRTDEEMNGDLHAAAAAQQSKASAMANFQPSTEMSYAQSQPSTPPKSDSPKPPGLPTSQSVLSAVETAHTTLTPEPRALHRSASAEGANGNAFSAIRNGIAGNIGRGMNALSNLGNRGTSPGPSTATATRTEQELHSLT